MFESGYYPPGAENDPRAPYNEVEREVECEAEALAKELVDTLNKRDDVVNIGKPDVEFDDGEVSVFAEATIKVLATAYGNWITDRYPEPTEEDIDDAAIEQYAEILSVDNWNIDRA